MSDGRGGAAEAVFFFTLLDLFRRSVLSCSWWSTSGSLSGVGCFLSSVVLCLLFFLLGGRYWCCADLPSSRLFLVMSSKSVFRFGRVLGCESPLPSAAFWCFAAVFGGFGLVVVTDLGVGLSRFGFLFYAVVMRFDFGCYRCFDGGG
ncbi:hypothetical protein P8452_13301 [Trifolium repens]|nr:hypothetical protein P8452_13301 [Trifolium repens]